jgi:hypothetical protein
LICANVPSRRHYHPTFRQGGTNYFGQIVEDLMLSGVFGAPCRPARAFRRLPTRVSLWAFSRNIRFGSRAVIGMPAIARAVAGDIGRSGSRQRTHAGDGAQNKRSDFHCVSLHR